MKLSVAQIEAWEWTHEDGSARRWHGTLAGSPPMAALMALVRKDFLTKNGGDGWPSTFQRTDLGRRSLSQNRGAGE